MDTKFHEWKREALIGLKEEFEINIVTSSRLYALWENLSPDDQRLVYSGKNLRCWCFVCFPHDVLKKIDPALYYLLDEAGEV